MSMFIANWETSYMVSSSIGVPFAVPWHCAEIARELPPIAPRTYELAIQAAKEQKMKEDKKAEKERKRRTMSPTPVRRSRSLSPNMLRKRMSFWQQSNETSSSQERGRRPAIKRSVSDGDVTTKTAAVSVEKTPSLRKRLSRSVSVSLRSRKRASTPPPMPVAKRPGILKNPSSSSVSSVSSAADSLLPTASTASSKTSLARSNGSISIRNVKSVAFKNDMMPTPAVEPRQKPSRSSSFKQRCRSSFVAMKTPFHIATLRQSSSGFGIAY